MIIYKITNKINNQFYIGKTSKSKEERFQKHIYDASYNSKTHLHRAMKKYGHNNFIIEEIESQIPEDKLNDREVYWINELKPHYNMTKGGEGGNPLNSPNFTEAMKNYHQRKPKEEYATYGMLGKKFSEKAKQKVAKANSYPVVCEGKEFPSIKAAEEYYKSLGTPKSVRKRIDNPKHTDWYRVRPKRSYPQEN